MSVALYLDNDSFIINDGTARSTSFGASYFTFKSSATDGTVTILKANDDSYSYTANTNNVVNKAGVSVGTFTDVVDYLSLILNKINVPVDPVFDSTSIVNSTEEPIASGVTWSGEAELNAYPDVMVVVATDQNGTLYMEFSTDGENWDTSLSFKYDTARINSPHILVKGARYYRTRFENTGASRQTYFRLKTYYGTFNKLTAPINGTLAENYDAIVTRPTDYISEVAMGKRQGRSVWNKFGYNGNVSAGTTEVVASWSSTFNPVTDVMSTAQTFTITYNNGTDGQGQTGATSLLITIIDSDYLRFDAIHTLGSTGTDITSFSGLGINRAIVLSNGGLGWNANNITFTATTDATTQAQIPAGSSVTQQCILHTQIGHTFLADYLRFKILKPSGGGTGSGYIVGYSWSRVTNTRYEVFRESYATSSSNDQVIEIKPSQKFPIGGREVLYFVIENTSGNNTRVEGRFSGIEERVV